MSLRKIMLVIMSAAFVLGISQLPAQAQFAICDSASYCLNDWFQGELVKASQAISNNDFTTISDGNGHISVQYQGSGPYHDDLVGDYQNNQFDAKAGLEPSGSWGTAVTLGFGCDGDGDGSGFTIKDNHWNAYISYTDQGGAQVYLNTSFALCYDTQ